MTTSEARMPQRKDFLNILEAHGAPEHVKRHCMAVGDVAVSICAALQDAGLRGLDMDAVRIAGFLHDIARTGKDHDAAGAELLKKIDFKAAVSEETRFTASEIVARHMKMNFPETVSGIDSAVVVSLADRTVKENVYVGYEARMWTKFKDAAPLMANLVAAPILGLK